MSSEATGEGEVPVPDGDYDALVIDAESVDPDAVVLVVTIVAGPHKGEVLELRGPATGTDPIDLLGLPAAVSVRDGRPRVTIER